MKNLEEDAYLDLLLYIINKSNFREDRTGVGTYNKFGQSLRFDLSKNFPLITTKHMWFKGIFEELRWMLSGSSNINDLKPDVKKIWEPWADPDGDLGITYGTHWRKMPTFEYDENGTPQEFDQIAYLITNIAKNPNSRRIVMNGWHTAHVDKVKLPWCHGSVIQLYVDRGTLSMSTYQRSADAFIGLPWNIAFYSLFLNVIANICHLKPKELTYFLGDVHVYSNHLKQVKLQASREAFEFPKLEITKQLEFKDLWNLNINDFNLIEYNSHPSIKGDIAI